MKRQLSIHMALIWVPSLEFVPHNPPEIQLSAVAIIVAILNF
jgi:hypothetical protein